MTMEWRTTWIGEDREQGSRYQVKQKKQEQIAYGMDGSEIGRFTSVDEAKHACEQHAVQSMPQPQPRPHPAQAPPHPQPHAPPEPPKPEPKQSSKPEPHKPPPRTTRR